MKRKLWTPQEDKIMRDNYPHKLTKEMSELLPHRTVSQIYYRAFALGIHKTEETRMRAQEYTNKILEEAGKKTRISPGNVPANKGKKIHEYMSPEGIERSKATRFKKGNKPHNTREVHDISIRKDTNGQKYAHIKIADANWELLHRYIYKKEVGPIPPGMNVQFKDGNTQNFDIENLELISKQENMSRNTIHNWPEDLKELKILVTTLQRRINKKEKNEKH